MAGRRIDDHNSWAGKGRDYPLPEGNKMKKYHSAEGVGEVGTDYPDTSEAIHRDQTHSESVARRQKMKSGQRY
jgi:hypothetical protein